MPKSICQPLPTPSLLALDRGLARGAGRGEEPPEYHAEAPGSRLVESTGTKAIAELEPGRWEHKADGRRGTYNGNVHPGPGIRLVRRPRDCPTTSLTRASFSRNAIAAPPLRSKIGI